MTLLFQPMLSSYFVFNTSQSFQESKTKLKRQSRNDRTAFFFRAIFSNHSIYLWLFQYKSPQRIRTILIPATSLSLLHLTGISIRGHLEKNPTFPSLFKKEWGSSDPYWSISSLAPLILKSVLVKTILKIPMQL